VVAVLVLAVGMFSHRHPHRNSAAPVPDAFASAPEQQALGLRGRRVSLGDGTPIDLAMQGALVYVLTRSPPRRQALHPRSQRLPARGRPGQQLARIVDALRRIDDQLRLSLRFRHTLSITLGPATDKKNRSLLFMIIRR
jgi:hypothetical protein